MSHAKNPADRSAEKHTDGKKSPAKDAQLEGNRRPTLLPRGAEGDTRRASGPR